MISGLTNTCRPNLARDPLPTGKDAIRLDGRLPDAQSDGTPGLSAVAKDEEEPSRKWATDRRRVVIVVDGRWPET